MSSSVFLHFCCCFVVWPLSWPLSLELERSRELDLDRELDRDLERAPSGDAEPSRSVLNQRHLRIPRQKLRVPPNKSSDDSDAQDVRQLLMTINGKLDQLLPLREVVEGIEDTLQFLSEQYDELQQRTERNENEIKDLKRRTERVEGNESDVNQLHAEIDQLEWRSRRLNLEFHGIQHSEKENLLEKLNDVAVQLELPQLSENDVVSVHRLPSKKENIPGIICRFAKQADRDRWWKSRQKLRESKDDVFLLENVTKTTRDLLFQTKIWAKRANCKYVWHSNGRVLVRKTDGERAVAVSTERHLDKLA
nr:uncharacterized protein LOC126548287 [Dermacentor andersoni]